VPRTIVSKNVFISVSTDYGATFTDLSGDTKIYVDLYQNYGNSKPQVFISPDAQSIGIYTNGGGGISVSTNFGSSFTALPYLPGVIKCCKINNNGYVTAISGTSPYLYTCYVSSGVWTSTPIIILGSANNFAASADLTSYVYLGTTGGVFKNSNPYNNILDLSGQLQLNQGDFLNYGNATIMGNTTHSGTSSFNKDISISGRLFLAGDASFNSRLNVGSDASFGGNLSVVGTLTKGGGSFDIAHPDPSKPSGMRLRHCFVEAPTRGDNMYRFKVTTENKSAIVNLPSYYKFLNEDTQIWVSPINCLGSGYGVLQSDDETIHVTVSEDGQYNVLIIGTRKDQMMIDFFDNAGGVEYLTK
jgi:hypothetical protein